ncbi:MAG: hypothetical protein IIA45_06080 [Bacteroidetes bacterium]|nr:hypothetical protein [Bacteroidota bacterium]
MRINILITLISIILLSSCDPLQTIELENKSQSTATIKFYFNGSDDYQFEGFVTNDSLILNLQPNEKKRFDFGIGTWQIRNSLDSLISKVEKVEILTDKSTETFIGERKIESFFKDHLIDDRYKARIIINIE